MTAYRNEPCPYSMSKHLIDYMLSFLLIGLHLFALNGFDDSHARSLLFAHALVQHQRFTPSQHQLLVVGRDHGDGPSQDSDACASQGRCTAGRDRTTEEAG